MCVGGRLRVYFSPCVCGSLLESVTCLCLRFGVVSCVFVLWCGCVCVSVYASLCVHVCLWLHVRSLFFVCVGLRMCLFWLRVCVCMCLFVCVFVWLHVRFFLFWGLRLCLWLFVSVCVSCYVLVWLYVSVYLCFFFVGRMFGLCLFI